MKRVVQLNERSLFFEGVPDMQRRNAVRVGQTEPEPFVVDLQLEYEAVKRLNDGIAACVAAGDDATRAMLEEILVCEDDHIDWIETQQETIRQIGEAHYLAQQMHE